MFILIGFEFIQSPEFPGGVDFGPQLLIPPEEFEKTAGGKSAEFSAFLVVILLFFENIKEICQIQRIFFMFKGALRTGRSLSRETADLKGDEAFEFPQGAAAVAVLAAFGAILSGKVFIFKEHHPCGGRGFVSFLSAVA